MPYAETGGHAEPAGSGGSGGPPSQTLIIHPFSRYIYVKAGPVVMTGPVLYLTTSHININGNKMGQLQKVREWDMPTLYNEEPK